MATSDAPVTIGRVALSVRDLDVVTDFYASALGLGVLRRTGGIAALGAGNRTLVELREDRAARARPGEAGLFHTAFLLPDRASLAAWLLHASDAGVRLDGASDHGVSEALYLSDPEGNGIEVYRDRPPEAWPRQDGTLRMGVAPLNLRELAGAAEGTWNGVPEAAVIGHVHLQVGDVDEFHAFATERLGLRPTVRLSSAGFYASGEYHHHLAGNVWQSAGAETRTPGTTGLADVELLADPEALAEGALTDPWGTAFTIVRR